MAPDRGSSEPGISDEMLPSESELHVPENGQYEDDEYASQNTSSVLAQRAALPQNFTIRGISIGLVIGVIVAFSNTYFGLQTGWISGMSMPASLIGFAIMRSLDPYLKMKFHPVENVLIQSVSGSVGTMPLGCGFVGVIPALEFLLKRSELPNGPLDLNVVRLIIWAVGVCLFGVVFAVPLRKEVILREKLKFPSGTATALTIGVLHGEKKDATVVKQGSSNEEDSNLTSTGEEQQALLRASHERESNGTEATRNPYQAASSAEMLQGSDGGTFSIKDASDWKAKIKLLSIAFGVSAVYTLFSHFVPQVHAVPVFGLVASSNWLWNLNPSPAYVGQGIIMGPATTIHMLLGCIIGWGILSPVAKKRGWAPGDVGEWEHGSKGWIVWVSLAIMLADSIVSLGWLILRPSIQYAPAAYDRLRSIEWSSRFKELRQSSSPKDVWTFVVGGNKTNQGSYRRVPDTARDHAVRDDEEEEIDAPAQFQITGLKFWLWLLVSVGLYFASIHIAFPNIIPFKASFLALVLSVVLSIMGVRALGETDLNPVSGISKITQLIFAAIIPASNPNGTIINLLAGAVSESASIQAGDLMQDLKTGHLLGASPAAQFNGQIIGSIVGAVVSAVVYKLYVRVYEVPGDLFQIPTGFVWVFTARLVTGQGLPPNAAQFAIGAAVIWSFLTALRTKHLGDYTRAKYAWARNYPHWQSFVPGGIAVAVGMYNTPSFTLARAVGGLFAGWWVKWKGGQETTVVILASGLILGEGLFSIVNLGLASAKVPHL